jgi:uncharacterized protein Veg
MSSKLAELAKTVSEIKAKLQAHLDEGVEVKLAIARLQVEQRIGTALILTLVTAVVGLYFKK